MRAAHAAKMRGFRAFLRQGFVVKFAGGFGVERLVELVFPAEFEARLAQGVVAILRAGMAFGQVGGVRGNFVGDDAVLHILFVRQTQMFLGRDVTKHRATVPTNHRRADAAGDVIVARRNVRRERPERVKRRFLAPFQLLFHVLLDHVHRHVAGPFVHHLHAVRPGAFGQIALHLEFRKLRLVVRIRNRAGTQTVADAEKLTSYAAMISQMSSQCV